MSTDLLETMREHARQTRAIGVDVEAAVRKGDQRRRGRAAGLSGLAIAAFAAVGFAVVPTLDSATDAPSAATGPREVSWAAGSTIYHGDAVLDASPWVVQSYVQTDDGYVFTDADGGVHLAAASGTEQIGSGVARGKYYLSADDSGPGDSGHHVAWIDSSGSTPALVVYDTAAREVVLNTTERFRPGMGTLRDDDPAFVYAVDGGYVYVRDAEGLSRVNVQDGSFELLAKGVGGFDVTDVTNGLIAHEHKQTGSSFGDDDIPMTMLLGTDYSGRGTPIPALSRLLSPDARYVVSAGNGVVLPPRPGEDNTFLSNQIYHVATATDVTPPLQGSSLLVSNWLDEETAVIVSIDDEGQSSLLACNIPTASCQVRARPPGEPGTFQLPIGVYID